MSERISQETGAQRAAVHECRWDELFTEKPGLSALTKIEIVLAIPAAVFTLLLLVKFFTSS
jgi:hypothetical protein